MNNLFQFTMAGIKARGDIMNNTPKNAIENVKSAIVNQLDQNGNGELDIADIIALAVQVPGIHVNRASFLQKELFKNHTQVHRRFWIFYRRI